MTAESGDAFKIKQVAFLSEFECLADKCEDTCCKGWSMQIDQPQIDLYKKEAPELLDAVTTDESGSIMLRDPQTDYCVKYTDGICSIHKEKGSRFLGDACNFFPRITRKVGDKIYRSAALSCPEVARLALFGDNPFVPVDSTTDRLPISLKDYAEGQDGDAAIGLINDFINLAGDESNTAERNLSKILTIGKSFELQPEEKWPEAFGAYLKMCDGLLAPPSDHFADSYRLVNILVALIQAAKKSDRLRLQETVATMESALNIRIDRDSLEIVNYSGNEYVAHNDLQKKWKESGAGAKMQPILRKWLQAQISLSAFPYSGFGKDIKERRITLAVRFATVKLAIMCHVVNTEEELDQDTLIRVIQSLSRFYDHLADPTFSMMAYDEAGWTQDSRLRGLIGDI